MLQKIEVTPIASESMGVRSLCTLIKTPDLAILIDPSSAVSKRFGYFPHPKEYRRLRDSTYDICKLSEEADVIVLSHYHYDHIKPPFTNYTYNWSSPKILSQIIQNKRILLKDPLTNINFNQKKRAHELLKFFANHSASVSSVDNKSVEISNTILEFSPALPHGYDATPLGFVVCCCVHYADEKVLYASDVQGPISNAVRDYVLSCQPSVLILSGPPLYLRGTKIDDDMLVQARNNLKLIGQIVPQILIDHHLCRTKNFLDWLEPIRLDLPKGNTIKTFSGFLGKEENLLEGQRRQLYERYPPDKKFMMWINLHPSKRNLLSPPID
ncbi:MAG: MBL fold metallo-hydrolase [Candidatus Ranarchaeia archaeon]